MRFHALHKNGNLFMVGDIGIGFTLNEEELKRGNPGYELVELTEEEFNLVKDDLGYFKYDKKIKSRTIKEKNDLDKARQDWKDENTVEGLKKKLEEVNKKVDDKIVKMMVQIDKLKSKGVKKVTKASKVKKKGKQKGKIKKNNI